MAGTLTALRDKQAFIIDMDGVIYHGNTLLPGAADFVRWLEAHGKKFLFLTNASDKAPRELQQKLSMLGIEVSIDNFYTSALATASFLRTQCPGGTAFVIGEAGLINALYEAGFTMSDVQPDYVVVGDTRSYTYGRLEKAVRMVLGGARLIGTSCDISDPTENGVVPSTGALIAPIELTTGRKAYFIGKPNPLMMRHAIKRLGCHREQTVIIGDRMDTDIVAGIETEIETVLVLSGVTSRDDLERFAYAPRHVARDLAEVVAALADQGPGVGAGTGS